MISLNTPTEFDQLMEVLFMRKFPFKMSVVQRDPETYIH